MIKVDPTSYMQMAKLNTQFLKSKLEQLAQSEKTENPNPVKGLKLSLFPMEKQH
ncbi:MAG: hypothetical protein Q8N63_03935 [Nanoarchaeota archaeon]|nr:hypothetical protein [Nanoarchaeota archaeon]